MKDVQAFNLLKLRAGYGVTGNSEITAFLYQDSFATSNTYNDKVVAVAERMPNDRLGWESAHMSTIGVDMSLLGRVNLTLDLYSTDNSYDMVISACAVQLYAKSHTGQIMITNMNLCIINIRHIKVVLLFICPQEDQTRV